MSDGLFGDISVATDTRFEQLWKSSSFRKLGKLEARKYFWVTIKTEQDWIDVQQASVNYAKHLQENPWQDAVWGERFFRPKGPERIPYWRKFVAAESRHGEFARFVK